MYTQTFVSMLAILELIILGLAAVILHKVRRIHVRLYDLESRQESYLNQSLMHLFHQLEASSDLRRLLQWDHPLPPTREWAASPDFLKIVAQTVLRDKPAVVVECGSGVSTLVTARCIQLIGEGHIYSLDHEPDYAQATRERLVDLGLSDFATVIDAPLAEVDFPDGKYRWYALDQLPNLPIDLFVIDGPPSETNPQARYPAGPLLFSRLAANAMVLVDDASRPDEQTMVNRWLSEQPTIRRKAIPQCEKGCIALLNGT